MHGLPSLAICLSALVFCMPIPGLYAESPAASQTTISGRVYDSVKGSGLPGLTVQLSPPKGSSEAIKLTITDTKGRYQLKDLRGHFYLMEVRWYERLCYLDTIDTVTQGNHRDIPLSRDRPIPELEHISITIERVISLENSKRQSRFYARVVTAGTSSKTTDIRPASNLSPDWHFEKFVARSLKLVPIKIEIKDSDSGILGHDSKMDINPMDHKDHLDIKYDIVSGNISGDVQANNGELIKVRGRGHHPTEIWFRVGK
jgi:hypothetical protein